VVAEDGYVLDVPRMRDTVLVDPGARYEAIVDATELGVWAFHCHVLSHAESRHGMFGMVTVLIVEE
jgi:FtsP/CotA-like multicopper oxidase with cupredoxin domain